jgi:hypothetical protein
VGGLDADVVDSFTSVVASRSMGGLVAVVVD